MLKTTADDPARFGTLSRALITYAILAEYVHHPLPFLLGTALTLRRFKRSVPKDVPREFVELFACPTWIYIRLKERLDQEKALALARAIIIPLGMAAYGAEFGLVEAPRTWTNFLGFLDLSLKQPSDGTAFTSFLATLNGSAFAGHSDWRLPTITELNTIFDPNVVGCGSFNPCIDSIFGPTRMQSYWTSNTGISSGEAWFKHFGNGTQGLAGKNYPDNVRAVR